MDDVLTRLIALRQLVAEQWPWIGLGAFLLYSSGSAVRRQPCRQRLARPDNTRTGPRFATGFLARAGCARESDSIGRSRP